MCMRRSRARRLLEWRADVDGPRLASASASRDHFFPFWDVWGCAMFGQGSLHGTSFTSTPSKESNEVRSTKDHRHWTWICREVDESSRTHRCWNDAEGNMRRYIRAVLPVTDTSPVSSCKFQVSISQPRKTFSSYFLPL